MYKRKAQKVRPVDSSWSDGSKPGGVTAWKKELQLSPLDNSASRFAGWIIPKFSQLARGARLTPERLDRMPVGDVLRSEERELLVEVLFNREAALAWDFTEIGCIRQEVVPPQEIRTIPHDAWQALGFPVPWALHGEVITMLKERLQAGMLEYCHGPYRNPWFLVRKMSGKHRLVNAAMNINKVTIRDANLPPSVDEFSEEFAGMAMTSLIDFFSGYDQVLLDTVSRSYCLYDATWPAPNDTSSTGSDEFGGSICKGRDEEFTELPGIRRYVLEHIQNLDKTLANIEQAGGTISGEKSQFCMQGVKFVGFICDSDGRSPESAEVAKILEWPACTDVTSGRAFIGICVYYRLCIKDFAVVAEPIFRLFKKNSSFRWEAEHELAMSRLKEALTMAPCCNKNTMQPMLAAII